MAMNSVHAHTVLEWIATQESGVTPMEAIEWSFGNLGSEARFHTCKRSGMDIRELLEFFVMAGKVTVDHQRMYLDPSRMCSHG